MYSYEHIFSGKGGREVVNVVCLFSPLSCNKYI